LAEKRKAVNEAYDKVAGVGDNMTQCHDSLEDSWKTAGMPASDLADLNAVMRQLNYQVSELSDTNNAWNDGKLSIWWDIVPKAEATQGTLNIAKDEVGKLSGKPVFIAGAIADAMDAKHYLGSAQGRLEEALKKLDAEPPDAEGAKEILKNKSLGDAEQRLGDATKNLNGTIGDLKAVNDKLKPTRTLLADAKDIVERAINKLYPQDLHIEEAKELLEEVEGYLDEASEVLKKAVEDLSVIQTSVMTSLSSLGTALMTLNTDLDTLSASLKELYDANNALKVLKAKKFYSPDRGWRVPRESDIILLVDYIMNPTENATEYNAKCTFTQMTNPNLSRLLSETWPYYDENGKAGLWPKNKRIGFDAVAQRQKGNTTSCDFWALRKIERVERDVNGQKVVKYDYTYGYFTISTDRKNAVTVSFTPRSGAQSIGMRLCRTVLKEG